MTLSIKIGENFKTYRDALGAGHSSSAVLRWRQYDARLVQQVQDLEEALAFYSDSTNYQDRDYGDKISLIKQDKGKRAQEALKL